MTARNITQPPPGPGVDAEGRSVIDPTDNVRQLLGAAVERLDDIQTLTAAHATAMADLRSLYEARLQAKETERIDAIRAVDVNAVQRAAEVQATQALALQQQVATSAEAMRAQVAAAAGAAAAALAAALEPITKSIEDLRRSQYELAGQRVAKTEGHGDTQWGVGIAVSIGLLSISVITVGFLIVSHLH